MTWQLGYLALPSLSLSLSVTHDVHPDLHLESSASLWKIKKHWKIVYDFNVIIILSCYC